MNTKVRERVQRAALESDDLLQVAMTVGSDTAKKKSTVAPSKSVDMGKIKLNSKCAHMKQRLQESKEKIESSKLKLDAEVQKRRNENNTTVMDGLAASLDASTLALRQLGAAGAEADEQNGKINGDTNSTDLGAISKKLQASIMRLVEISMISFL